MGSSRRGRTKRVMLHGLWPSRRVSNKSLRTTQPFFSLRTATNTVYLRLCPKRSGGGGGEKRKKEYQACTVSSQEEEDLKQWQATPATITPYRSEVTDPQTFLLLYSIGSTAEQLEDEVYQRWRGTNQEEDRNKELDQESFPRMDDISSLDEELRHGILKEMRGIKSFKLRGSKACAITPNMSNTKKRSVRATQEHPHHPSRKDALRI
nr:uncharacterized protein LOC116826755 [Chelonoidis abingdonii]